MAAEPTAAPVAATEESAPSTRAVAGEPTEAPAAPTGARGRREVAGPALVAPVAAPAEGGERTVATEAPPAVAPTAGTSATASVPTAPVAPPAPVATTSVSPSAPASAPAPAAPTAPPLVDQLRAPVAALRALPDGAHVVTLRVSPDELGPITVRAVVQGGALEVQLAATTDAARDAIKALLPDLRRDLAQGGQPAMLSLGDAAADGRSASRDANAREFTLPERLRSESREPAVAVRPTAPVRVGASSIDVFA